MMYMIKAGSDIIRLRTPNVMGTVWPNSYRLTEDWITSVTPEAAVSPVLKNELYVWRGDEEWPSWSVLQVCVWLSTDGIQWRNAFTYAILV